jgi:NAD(P)-dependent dehydrogenase (short-subunit alcohol dehydrogenase family)
MSAWTTELLFDRVAITGGGSGIGQGVALELARFGATSYILGRRDDALEETVARAREQSLAGRIVPLQCDLRDPEAVDAAFCAIERDGAPVPGLVHGALSFPGYAPGEDITPALFREVIDSALFGAFNVIHRWSGPLLAGGHPGVGITLTSAFATAGTPGSAHTSAGKAGIEALVRSLAREWGGRGLRLNVVGPGFFPVERTRSMFEPGQPGSRVVAQTALGRTGELHEIVGPIVFLLTAAAGYMTGETVIPDGGFTLTPHVLAPWNFTAPQILTGE